MLASFESHPIVTRWPLFGSKPPFLAGPPEFRNEATVWENVRLWRAFGWAIGHTSGVSGIQLPKSEGVRRLLVLRGFGVSSGRCKPGRLRNAIRSHGKAIRRWNAGHF